MRKLWLPALMAVVNVFSTSVYAQIENLKLLTKIPPRDQSTPEWCWLATGEMIFRYYNIPANYSPLYPGNYQCGIVRFQGANLKPANIPPGTPKAFMPGVCWWNCGLCASVPAGPVEGIRKMLVEYPWAMRELSGDASLRIFREPQMAGPVSPATIKAEIDARRPLVAGISPDTPLLPPGLAQHAVLIVGYEQSGTLSFRNDPFPYQAWGNTHWPRESHALEPAGQFEIGHAELKNYLNWNTTVYGIGP